MEDIQQVTLELPKIVDWSKIRLAKITFEDDCFVNGLFFKAGSEIIYPQPEEERKPLKKAFISPIKPNP